MSDKTNGDPESLAERRVPVKNKGGRPRGLAKKLTDEHLRQIEVLAGYGMPEWKIAHVLGMSAPTLYKNKRLREDVAAAIARGFAVQETKISRALAKKAESGDMPAIRWWEMTRAGRRAASDITSGGESMSSGITYVIQSAAGELKDEDEDE